MLKFRTSVLALDPCAKFFVDGNPLKVTHSRCGGKITQRAANDVSNFRDHVSVCQSVPPNVVTPAKPSCLPCPGSDFGKLCGKDYMSLPHQERQQVINTAEATGLVWLDPREKNSIISKPYSKKSPSSQETYKPKHEWFNPFLPMDAKTRASIRRERGVANVSQLYCQSRFAFADKLPVGVNLVPVTHILSSVDQLWVTVGV